MDIGEKSGKLLTKSGKIEKKLSLSQYWHCHLVHPPWKEIMMDNIMETDQEVRKLFAKECKKINYGKCSLQEKYFFYSPSLSYFILLLH